MRNDLLEAKACIDWTKSKLPSLGEQIEAWLSSNLCAKLKDPDPAGFNNIIVSGLNEPVPRFFNVEVGAYINVIRSSLDILATTLARRFEMDNPDNVAFPIAKDANDFVARKFKAKKLLAALPPKEKALIESLNPYGGGNQLLWMLHELDNTRKHRNLLSAVTHPSKFRITGWGLSDHFTPVSGGWMKVDDEEAVLGLLTKGAPSYKMQLSGFLAIGEIHKPVDVALNDFANLADYIIGLFDS